MRVQIQPVKWKYNLSEEATQLGVTSINDNLKSSCTLLWRILDINGNVQDTGNITIAGDDYAAWDGGNSYPINFTAKAFGLTIINP